MDEQQQVCVETEARHMLIVAGPGSGKTRTVVAKCAAFARAGVAPGAMICITFTNKAAAELKQRIQQHVHDGGGDVRVGTYHHIALLTLRHYKVGLFGDEFTLLTTNAEASRHFKKTLSALNMSWTSHAPAVLQLYHAHRLKPADQAGSVPPLLSPTGQTLVPAHVVHECFKTYEAHKAARYMVDYDDLMHAWLSFLQSDTDDAAVEHARVRVVFADEVQDSNDVQHAILTTFAQRGASIVAVGDPDQSIYAFRGSNMQNMLNFAATVPETVQLHLSRNYRSTPQIVRVCQLLIEYNHHRIHKDMTAVNEEGPKPSIYGFTTAQEEAEFVCGVAAKALQHGLECAILCRTNREVDALCSRFERARLPFAPLKGSQLLERPHVKELLLLYKFVFCKDPPSEVIQGVAVMHKVSKTAAAKLATELQRDTTENSIAAVFLNMELDAIPLALRGLFDSLLTTRGALDVLHATPAPDPSSCRAHAMRIGCACVNHLTLMQLATANSEEQEDLRQVEKLRDSFNTYQEFEDALALGHIGTEREGSAALIKVGTIHQAKGLEFESCVITGCADGSIPLATSMSSLHEVEEERRLLFVAASRAKHQLCFTYSQYAAWDDDKKKTRRLSQFLRPLVDSSDALDVKGQHVHVGSTMYTSRPAKCSLHDMINHFMHGFGRFNKLYAAAAAMLKFKVCHADVVPCPLYSQRQNSQSSYLGPGAQNELLFKHIFLALFRTPDAEWKDVVDAAVSATWGDQLFFAQRAARLLRGTQTDAGMPANTWPVYMDAVQALSDRLLAAEPQRLAVSRTVKVGVDECTVAATVDLVIDTTLFAICYTRDDSVPSHAVISLLGQAKLLTRSGRYTIGTYVLYNMYTGQLWRAAVPTASALAKFAAALPLCMRAHPLVNLIVQ